MSVRLLPGNLITSAWLSARSRKRRAASERQRRGSAVRVQPKKHMSSAELNRDRGEGGIGCWAADCWGCRPILNGLYEGHTNKPGPESRRPREQPGSERLIGLFR